MQVIEEWESAAPERVNVYFPIDDLIVLVRNPKEHDKDGIRASFNRYGFADPVLVNFNHHLLSGHGRIEVLKEMRLMGEAAPRNILVADDTRWWLPISPVNIPVEEEEAFAITVNRLTETGGWNDDQLFKILAELQKDGKLEATGFEVKDVEEYEKLLKLAENAEEEPEIEQELPDGEVTTVAFGDLYRLGRHFIFCADSSVREYVQIVLSQSNKTPDIMWVDAPYGQDYKSNMRTKFKSKAEREKFGKIENDLVPYVEFMPHASHIPVWYVCCRWDVADYFKNAIMEQQYEINNRIMWYKPGGGMGDLDCAYIFNHEDIWYAQAPGARVPFRTTREADVWQIPKDPSQSYRHPNQKPEALIQKAYAQHVTPNGVIYDPCVGGGSSILAAQNWEGGNPTVLGMELDPQHVQSTITAFEQLTGIKAVFVKNIMTGVVGK